MTDNFLLEQYKELLPATQRILQIRSLIFATNGRDKFVDLVFKAKIKSEPSLTLAQVKVAIKELCRRNFLTADYNINPEIAHDIAIIAATSTNIACVKQVLNLRDGFNFANPWEAEWMRYQFVYLAVYANNEDIFTKELVGVNGYEFLLTALAESNFINIIAFDLAWIKTRHPVIQIWLCCAGLNDFYSTHGASSKYCKEWIEFYNSTDFGSLIKAATVTMPVYIYRKLAQINLCLGLLTATVKEPFCQQAALGATAFFQMNMPAAMRYYANSVKLFSYQESRRDWYKNNLHVYLYVLSLIYQESFVKAKYAISQLQYYSYHDAIFYILWSLLYLKQNNLVEANKYLAATIADINRRTNNNPVLIAFVAWAKCLIEPNKINSKASVHKKLFLDCLAMAHFLVAHIYAELVLANDPADAECLVFLTKQTPFGAFRFLELLKIKQPWEYAVDQLNIIISDKTATTTLIAEKRLIWLIDPDNAKTNIEAVEQKRLKSGAWSDGKTIPMIKLREQDDAAFSYLTDLDRIALAGMQHAYHSNWYCKRELSWDTRKTIKALIGHALVFHAKNRTVNLELIKGDLGLQVEHVATGYHLSLSKHSTVPCIFLERETSNRYRVIEFSPEMVMVGKILSKDGLTVPADAKEKVIEIIRHAKSGIRINSELDDDNIPTVIGCTTCCVHIFPINGGMKLDLFIKPLGEHGHCYRVAQGQKNIIDTIVDASGVKTKQKVIRSFTQERNSAKNLIESCPTLAEFNQKTGEWCFEAMETCLEVLLELDEYKKNHAVNIEWPKGETLKLKQAVSHKNLSMSIKGSNGNWFEYEGEVKLDHGLTISMKSLLDLFEANNHGRFIRLADGEFIALTAKFKKHLEDLKAISEGNKVYKLSTGILRDLAANDDAEVSFDKAWSQHIKKLQAMEKHNPIIPATLQATLREYQAEGFKYLSRLAHWEIGACLADDMGVGKTVQTIALLLEHAPRGPILVVAPTSVCFVWLEELAKFAPTLRVHLLAEISERQALIKSLTTMDVLICSYNLLHQAGEVMTEKNWQIVVLDEAQAIKNHGTKRWQCATQLKSNCRVALTGTPIENHLGELWSIFRFLNPGLLGSLQSFQNRYSAPIERYNDPVAKRALKNLVYPYILRRTKSEVLQELPAKTEQSIVIEPTSEELAFYEALRLKSLQRIQDLGRVSANTKRFSILAEIARLRQACCHSSLADPNINIESSKIKTFLSITKNLIDNNHKVLVFSQYVRYLDKIQEVLMAENITYQYLDGAVPIKVRRAAVSAFQAGESDVFLISLKAGGSGLNLTAADYVIILDPWWNPAVEDQAIDRAHRIGQQRPVTVYRLIMQHSIEEKIVELHKNKKDLADDLLDGSNLSGKITEDDLMQLMDA